MGIESIENDGITHVEFDFIAGVGSIIPMVGLDMTYVNKQITEMDNFETFHTKLLPIMKLSFGNTSVTTIRISQQRKEIA